HRAGVLGAAGLFPGLATQQLVDRLVGSVVAPQREVVVRRGLRRQVVRQVRPLTPGPVLVEDRVDDLPQLVPELLSGSAPLSGVPRPQERAGHRPLLLGYIARVAVA